MRVESGDIRYHVADLKVCKFKNDIKFTPHSLWFYREKFEYPM